MTSCKKETECPQRKASRSHLGEVTASSVIVISRGRRWQTKLDRFFGFVSYSLFAFSASFIHIRFHRGRARSAGKGSRARMGRTSDLH